MGGKSHSGGGRTQTTGHHALAERPRQVVGPPRPCSREPAAQPIPRSLSTSPPFSLTVLALATASTGLPALKACCASAQVDCMNSSPDFAVWNESAVRFLGSFLDWLSMSTRLWIAESMLGTSALSARH